MAKGLKATETPADAEPDGASDNSGSPPPGGVPAPKNYFDELLKGLFSEVDAPPPPGKPKPPEAHPIPGLELLGRGIYLKPRQPYELKERLVGPNPAELVGPPKPEEHEVSKPKALKKPKPEEDKGPEPPPIWREIYCAEAGRSYLVPTVFEVNHSPPMPANQTLNQTVIEHSFESLESRLQVDANIAVGTGGFSLGGNYSQVDQLRSSVDAYYALRTSFIPSWTVDYTGQLKGQNLEDLKEFLEACLREPVATSRQKSSINATGSTQSQLEKIDEDNLKVLGDIDRVREVIADLAEDQKEKKLQEIEQLLEKIFDSKGDVTSDDVSKLVKIGLLPDDLTKGLEQKDPNSVSCAFLILLKQIKQIKKAKEQAEEQADKELATRNQYEKFFQRYGTHFVKRVWVGGTATLAFAITKSSVEDVQEIQAGINASYGGVSGGAATDQQDSLATLKENSTCSVWGKGGDESALAGLNSLEQENYNRWLLSVKDNPQVIDLEVVGIWSLLRDEKNKLTKEAEGLREEYRRLYEFEPIAAAFSPFRDYVYLIKSAAPQKVRVIQTNLDSIEKVDEEKTGDVQAWDRLEDRWAGLTEKGFDRIDAAFSLPKTLPGSTKTFPGLKSGDWGPLNVCFFRQDRYIWLDMSMQVPADSSPKLIKDGWKGITFESIDAAFYDLHESIYFFSGDQYVRFNWTTKRADKAYPKKISKHWAGVTFDRIDAAIYWGNGKVFFFRGDRYIAYDMTTYRADPGYPKFLPGSYVQDWKIFD